MKKIFNNKYVIIGLALLAGGTLGWWMKPTTEVENIAEHEHMINEKVAYTCSMHPQIRQAEPGSCPICGMDLIPVSSDSDSDEDPMKIKMSPTAIQLTDVQTAKVQMKPPTKIIRLTGKVQPDERQVFSQTSHISGRIEKLHLNYTGEYIRKGQVIAYIYSPELVTAQKELFEANKIKMDQPMLYRAAREKLKNWKLTEKQIDVILASGEPMESFPILSDLTGVVTSKNVNLGDHIKQGAALFEVANLSKVWILFDLHESDLAWVSKGDKVNYTVQSFPGETFSGVLSFVDPVIDAKSRVAKTRISVNNTNGTLKPEMFVSGTIESFLKEGSPAIIVPKSSVMWTGERSVVYVKSRETKGLHFILRQVRLGPSLGDQYVILEGLEVGEEIAVNGTFSIDAAAQLAGKPSMMSPEGDAVMTAHNHEAMSTPMAEKTQETLRPSVIDTIAQKELSTMYEAYFKMKDALVADDYESAKHAGVEFKSAVGSVKMSVFSGASHKAWMKYSASLKPALEHLAHQSDIDQVRGTFLEISNQLIILTQAFKPLEQTTYVQHCPMANTNKGADWLSLEKEVKNPYFGAAMLTCGENRIIISSSK